MKNRKTVRERLRGVTLVEIMIATAIFVIGYGAIMLSLKAAYFSSVNAMIKFSSLQYAQSLLEVIQSYPYQDESYETAFADGGSPASIFSQHTVSYGTFDANSGVWKDDNSSMVLPLSEEAISIRYRPTTENVLALVSEPERSRQRGQTPFLVAAGFQNNERILGPEDNDKGGFSNPAAGLFKITEKQVATNTFNQLSQAKYFFMDDVDDFDGYTEIREILPGVNVTYTVSVAIVYPNTENFSMNEGGTDYTLTQPRFGIMSPININALPSNPYTVSPAMSSMTDDEKKDFLANYYNQGLFKKVTVRATWFYPEDSTTRSVIVLDGGKTNPNVGA